MRRPCWKRLGTRRPCFPKRVQKSHGRFLYTWCFIRSFLSNRVQHASCHWNWKHVCSSHWFHLHHCNAVRNRQGGSQQAPSKRNCREFPSKRPYNAYDIPWKKTTRHCPLLDDGKPQRFVLAQSCDTCSCGCSFFLCAYGKGIGLGYTAFG